jgi:hypothetical protein
MMGRPNPARGQPAVALWRGACVFVLRLMWRILSASGQFEIDGRWGCDFPVPGSRARSLCWPLVPCRNYLSQSSAVVHAFIASPPALPT